MGESNLTDRGRRLALLQPQPALEAQVAAAECNGAGGHQNDLLAAPAHAGHVHRQAFQPGTIQAARISVDEQGGSDFDDDSFRLGQAARGGFAVGGGHERTILAPAHRLGWRPFT